MADSVTINYSWAYPTVNADDSTWGATINATINAIDTDLKTVDNKATGGAQKTANLSDLASASTARTNLGLGTVAVLPASGDGNHAATTNGGVSGNVTKFDAVGNVIDSAIAASNIVLKSNNLSDLASAATARTNLGLGSIATRVYSSGTAAPSGGSNGDLYGQYA